MLSRTCGGFGLYEFVSNVICSYLQILSCYVYRQIPLLANSAFPFTPAFIAAGLSMVHSNAVHNSTFAESTQIYNWHSDLLSVTIDYTAVAFHVSRSVSIAHFDETLRLAKPNMSKPIFPEVLDRIL